MSLSIVHRRWCGSGRFADDKAVKKFWGQIPHIVQLYFFQVDAILVFKHYGPLHQVERRDIELVDRRIGFPLDIGDLLRFSEHVAKLWYISHPAPLLHTLP